MAIAGCPYIDSFGDRCNSRLQMGDDYCHEHLGLPCSICDGQATTNCRKDGPMGGPCGFSLCSKHRCRADHDKKWHE